MHESLQLRKFKLITLFICSIINIVSCVVCVALEVAHPFIGKGVWSGAFYIVTGFLGYSASYTPTRPLIITTVVFSSFSICIAIAVSILSAVCSIECSFSDENIIKECHMQPIEVTLAIVNLVAVINNVVVTSSLKKFTCCSLGKPNETTVQLDQETCRPCPIHQCQSTNNYQSSMELPPPAYSSLVFESNDLPTNA